MTTLRVALLHLRIGVMNDLQYRVNFVLQILQSLLVARDRPRRPRGSSTRTRPSSTGGRSPSCLRCWASRF